MQTSEECEAGKETNASCCGLYKTQSDIPGSLIPKLVA